MSTIKGIIQNMSTEIRAKAEAFARAKGISLEEAVATQLSAELTEREMQGVSGGLTPHENLENVENVED